MIKSIGLTLIYMVLVIVGLWLLEVPDSESTWGLFRHLLGGVCLVIIPSEVREWARKKGKNK